MAVTSPRPADNHDYRECFYDSQPDRRRAAQVCPRFPCRVYREGYQHGYADGRSAGYSAGYAAGYAEGYSDGQAAAQGQDGAG
jgi:hypothetical protein